MQTVTVGRTVLYTFRRSGDAADITRPAIVTEVFTAQRNKAADPMRPSRERVREEAVAVRLVVLDEKGSRGVDAAVFEDPACEGGVPAFQCWGWPVRVAEAAPPAGKGAKPKK